MQMWPFLSIKVWICGFSLRKSCCWDKACVIQHVFEEDSCTSETPSSITISPSACSWAATQANLSFSTCEALNILQIPITFFSFPPASSTNFCHTEVLSFNTALIPFSFPHNVGSGWSVGNTIDWTWFHVSGSPGCKGAGLLTVYGHMWMPKGIWVHSIMSDKCI